ncbi:uncharacterized protein LOC108737689 [Agrilus planipennis]|uniref:Uncharacterized protein LOC108737689 n=1 Tax=Agrilus planipennis TaxID=224129 RepID=A0A1W4X1N0_AGRPL|nr:uncharacterized protein LOC108737689 [Agrilus planipennis]
MESSQAPSEGVEDESSKHDPEMARFESMITSEQVLSATANRRRRNLSKRMANRARERTPCRDVMDKSTTDDDADADAEPTSRRPKTPERKRRKLKKPAAPETKAKTSDGEQNQDTEIAMANDKDKPPQTQSQLSPKFLRARKVFDSTNSREQTPEPSTKLDNSTPPAPNNFLSPNHDGHNEKRIGEINRRNTLIGATQNEIMSLVEKAKRSLIPSKNKDRFRKPDKEKMKRSKSAPKTLEALQYCPYPPSEEDLVERLRKAQLVMDDPRPSLSRKPSSKDKSRTKPSEEDKTPKSTPLSKIPLRRPVSKQQCDQLQKKKSPKIISTKVIEVLDPKTSRVVAKFSKGPPLPPFELLKLFSVLRTFTVRELFTEYRKFKRDRIDEYQKIRNLRKRCLCNLLLIMILCGLGGICFRFIEGSFENFYKCGVKRVKRDFIDLLWYRSHNFREEDWKSLARNKLRTFEEDLHAAHEAGVHSYSGQRSWSFRNGVMYCLTLITTIGYGHITPQTTTGRALTIVYAIIGIPLFLIALTDFGKLFTRGIKFVWSFVRRIYYTGNCRRARKTAHMKEIFKGAQMMYEIATLRRPSVFGPGTTEDPENPNQTANTDTPTTPALSNFEIDDEFNLPISVAIFILVVYIFLGAIIYWVWEEWDFFAAFYFVFISMSTVGFGDFVPRNDICMIFSIVYLCFGLALMSMCFNVVQVKLSDTFKEASSKLGATIGIEVVDEDGSITMVPPATVEMPEIHDTKINENGNAKNANENKEELQNGDITDLQKIKRNVSGSLSDPEAAEVEDLTKESAKKK